MLKKIVVFLVAVVAGLAALGFVMYKLNAAPLVPTISAVEARSPSKPYVIKVHAKWCPVCMVTKGVWSQIENTYANRVNLLVLDVTNQETADASRAEAQRLGLQQIFDDYGGGTGTIVVLDGRGQVAASISGSRNFDDYRNAIDPLIGH